MIMKKEQDLTLEPSSRVSKIRKKIVRAFIGVALVASTGYAGYQHVFKEPISHKLDIEHVLFNSLREGNLKAGLLTTIDQSDYDPTTRSWVLSVANEYKDSFAEHGLSHLLQQVKSGLISSPEKVNNILAISDDEKRTTAILIETAHRRSNQELLDQLNSVETQTLLQRINQTHGEQMSLSQINKQRSVLLGYGTERSSDFEGKSLVELADQQDPRMRSLILELLISRSNSTLYIENKPYPATYDSLVALNKILLDYYHQHGYEKTHFLINYMNFSVRDYELFRLALFDQNPSPNNSSTTNTVLEGVDSLYDQLLLHDSSILSFFLDETTKDPNIAELYRYLNLNLDVIPELSPQQANFKPYFIKLAGGNQELGTIMFLEYFMNSQKKPDTQSELENALFNEHSLQLIDHFRLNSDQMIYFATLFGGFFNGWMWDESQIKRVLDHPELLYQAGYDLVSQDENQIEQVYLAYNFLSPSLPDKLTPMARSIVSDEIAEAIKNSQTTLSASELSNVINQEVIQAGSLLLVRVQPTFSILSQSETDPNPFVTIDIPLRLVDFDDDFVSFQNSESFITPRLQFLQSEQFITDISSLHYLYFESGQLKFGKIKTKLDQISPTTDATTFNSELQSVGITSLTRVLPVSWIDGKPQVIGHTERINSESFSGILIVSDSDDVIINMYVVQIPMYELANIDQELLRNTLGIRDDENVNLLLPDAGFATTITSPGSDPFILTPGVDASASQTIHFLPSQSRGTLWPTP